MSVPEELEDLSLIDEADIPEATRDQQENLSVVVSEKQSGSWLIFGIGGILLSVGIVALLQTIVQRPDSSAVSEDTTITNPTSATPELPAPEEEEAEQLLGHFFYEEAPASDLIAVSADGRLTLRSTAAEKFQQMQSDAQRNGIHLVLISGFRSVEEQKYLFFEVKEQRAQDTTKRAEVSAPPRYSEHHTGYAIDIGDGNVPATHLSQKFENTAAFQWMQNNAARYSFELSFPRDNAQGIAYEPWHWRFVGDQESLETFYKSRSSTVKPPKVPAKQP